MSPHGTPRSFRHMDGFGVHSFRLVNDKGESHLVKFHWKTKQGLASLIWEEAQILSGKNADFHRQDLWDAIQAGNGPEWELSIQLVKEEDALAFGFDMLDPTKILPLEFAPLQPLGVMKLDRNPTNYFAETEQAMVSNPSQPEMANPQLTASRELVPSWTCRPRHRLQRGPSAAGAHLLVPGHPTQPPQRSQL